MLFHIYCRIFQFIYKQVMYLLPWREPKRIQGEHTLLQLPQLLKQEQLSHVLLVTDRTIASLHFFLTLCDELKAQGLHFTVFDKVVPNPTIDNIENGRQSYLSKNCQAIVAIGGGSAIDCAKGIAARLARPKKTIPQLKGQLKVRKKVPKLFAIPTTSGTGSEATVAAVITDSQTREKYAVNDLVLIPYATILDPMLTVNLPPHVTATTGMDALTHAVEAFIGHMNHKRSMTYSLEATKLIFENIETAYSDGANIEARTQMQIASYKAGLAFTRSYVGNIHAIAHTLGGFYNVPHGLANAVIMPYVLRFYGVTIHKKLAQLAQVAGITTSNQSEREQAVAFIEAIERLNERMHIPRICPEIQLNDIPTLVDRAFAEANPLYPVPVIMTKQQLTTIYIALSGKQ